jgi:hypothetical protein
MASKFPIPLVWSVKDDGDDGENSTPLMLENSSLVSKNNTTTIIKHNPLRNDPLYNFLFFFISVSSRSFWSS